MQAPFSFDMLIGSDYYFNLVSGEIERGDGGPVAINSAFGWLVCGPTAQNENFSGISITHLIIENTDPLLSPAFMVGNQDNEKLTRATEAIGIEEKTQPTEPNFVRDVQFLANESRYEVGLPWKAETVPNSTGYNMCVKCLRQLQSRLKKDKTLFQDYDHIIREQEISGIVEQTNDNENSGYFLPHHGVIRQNCLSSGSTESSETPQPIKQPNCNYTDNTDSIRPQSTDLEPEMPISDQHCHAKILGLNWNVHTDELQCDTTELLAYAKSLPATKRSVLKLSAKVFDPLGLLSPFTINMKILFQILCNNNIDWDDPLDSEILTQWTGILNNLGSLIDVKVPRCYFQFTGKTLHHEIHGFSDASERAYAAVVYLRTEHANGNIEATLIAAKMRVAPLSKQSIPRLELLGALILARLVKSILQAFQSVKIDDVFLWTDSLTTLCWIKNNKNWKQYVQNRVQEIRELTDKENWKHCPGHLNPADLPSRGCSGNDLVDNDKWWSGPDFLQLPKDKWPTDPQSTQPYDELANTEIIKQPPLVTHSLTSHSKCSDACIHLEKIIDVENFSSKERVLRVTARVLRFVKRARKQHGPFTTELGAEELREAEKLWVQSIQNDFFAEELSCLKSRHD